MRDDDKNFVVWFKWIGTEGDPLVSGGTLSDFVVELALTYKIISPMPGVLPTSPLKRKRQSFEDAENQQSHTPVSQQAGEERSPRQREAEIYCSKMKLNKMKKFTEDTMRQM